MNIVSQIQEGKTSLGIELGSTRIKAVIVGEDFLPIASGSYSWENKLENGIWTYGVEDIKDGLQECYKSLSQKVYSKYGIYINKFASIGISAMMHGYLAFDKEDNLLTPFRTWRNTTTGQAAEILSKTFNYNIPQRWSIAHLYQAILNKEEHIGKISFITTLAGYVHWLLTGEKVLGIGDASGMFPIDWKKQDYNLEMISSFEELVKESSLGWRLTDILPKIIPAGYFAGNLTEKGAELLDTTGILKSGIPFCPPEGDAETGMVATNSIAPKTGNVSAGTSIFAMVVLENDLSTMHEEIDIVATPSGSPVAMVHCNNCTTELDVWVNMYHDFLKTMGFDLPKNILYDKLYDIALSSAADCSDIIIYNYHSGEPVTGFTDGVPLMIHGAKSDFNASNIMRSLIYSCLATLKIGMDILLKQENVKIENMLAHGGLFKSPITGQRFLSASLEVPVTVMQSAGEGGAWGIALLAAYSARSDKDETLEEFLQSKVFAMQKGLTLNPYKTDVKGFEKYMEKYKQGLAVERSAVSLNIN